MNVLVLGKVLEVRLVFVVLFFGGYLFIEDLFGLGKIMLVYVLVSSFGFSF